MQHLYMMISRQKTWGAILTGLWLCLLTAGGLMAQVPSCGPNQLLTGYLAGATTVASTTGTVTSATNVIGVVDGTTATLNANSGVTLDMGSVLPAGNSLIFTYSSADANAPLQVLVASSAAGPYTNIAQLSSSTVVITSSISLPIDTRYVKLSTTGTVYYPDAVTYPIYKCVNNPAPTCAAGQTLLTYPAGSQSVNGTTGTVTTSTNATGPPDETFAQIYGNSTITLDLGSLVTAGNKISLSYKGIASSNPLQVLVSTTGSPGSFTNIGSFQPSTSTTSGGFTLPFDARYVQLVTSGANSYYYIDALTYPLYSCVTLPSIACASGQQSVIYNVGAQGTNTTTGTVNNSANIIGVYDGTVATITANSSMIVNMGSLVDAGKTLAFTYSSGDNNVPMQLWTATAVGGPYKFIGTLPGANGAVTRQITLPLGAQYIKMVTGSTAYSVDAVTYPVYSCAAIPNTNCPTGQVSVSTQSGGQGLSSTNGTITNSSNILGTVDTKLAVLSTNSSLIINMGSLIDAGNQLTINYNSVGTTAPLQILVATSPGGSYTNIAQVSGSTNNNVVSVVLPIAAQYVQLQTTGTSYSVDAVTQTLYSCVASPASCPTGQQSISYQAGGAVSVYATTGTVSNPTAATGLVDGVYATLNSGGTITLDLGATAVAASTLNFTYDPADDGTPLVVSVASSPGGPYTPIGILPGNIIGVGTNSLTLPVGARYVKITVDTSSPLYLTKLDAISYTGYTCATPVSTSCAASQKLISYPIGTQGIAATTGTVSNSASAAGPTDGVVAIVNANSSITLDLGSLVPAGNVFSLAYYSQYTSSNATPIQVFVSSTGAAGSFTNIASFPPSTSTTSGGFTLPFDARYVQLVTSGTFSTYYIDALTYAVYACVTPPSTNCPTGKMLVGYTQGAVGSNGTTGTVSTAANASGNPDGATALLYTNSSIILDMGSTVASGNSLMVTYWSGETSVPLQVLVSTSAGGPYTNIGQLPGSIGTTTNSIQLPLNARYVQLLTSSAPYFVDAVTYPVYSCVSPPATICASGQILTSYNSGAQGVGVTTGTVSTATNAIGTLDGNTAALSANSSLILNLGSIVSAGNTLKLTYFSGNTTSPLQVLVATNSSGPYTNIAQLPGNTSSQTVNIVLPLDAQFVKLQTAGTAYWFDAITQTLYSCVDSPVTACPAGQVSDSYQAGVQAIGATAGTVTSPSNIIGTPNGTVAAMSTNSSLITDLGSAVAAGTTVYLTYSSANTTAPMQVLVATSASGPFTNIAQLAGSTSSTTQPVTLPLSARYIQLQTTGTAYSPDAITYPVYTCVTPVSSTCGTGQQSISYQSGVQGLGTTTGTVTNSTAMTGVPDGALATIGANSSVVLDLGTVVSGGNSLQVTYSSANTTAPMQVLVATSAGGPYVNIAQLPGSTTATMQTVDLPVDARYVQLVTTGTVYSADAVTYPVYTCVNNPASICSVGQQVISYNTGATNVNGATSVTNPSYGTGTSDGAYAVVAANGMLNLDLGSVVGAGNTINLTYKSGNLVAPLQVLIATNSVGPYTNISQLPASTTKTTVSVTLPVDAKYVQLQTKSTTYSVDAVTYAVYSCVSSTITSGIVYVDGNINGVLNSTEQGLGGVTVKAYDASGNLVGTTTTSYGNPTLNIPAGYYSFNNLTAGQPYKLEFSNWPSQYSPSVYGTNDGTTLQFIQGVTQNNDLGLYVPSTVCSFLPDPRMVTAKGLVGGSTSVDSYNYYDQSIYTNTQTKDIDYTQIGVPIGLASQRPNNWIYMSPISTNMPTVFPQAPDGSSAIYIANYNGPNGTQAYQGEKLLVKLSDLGIDVGNPSTTVGGNPFGVQGLGGLDFSQSGDTMYVVNMSDGKLVQVDVSKVDYNNLPATAPTSAVEITPPSALANCSGGVFRPTALKQYGGKIYMGGVCDAEVSQSSADLKGVVLAYDPATQTWSKTLSYPIDFTAGNLQATGLKQGGWTSSAYIQPVLLDLAFADNGEMVIGTTNRNVYGQATSDQQHGYIMGAWPNGDGTYTLENAGKLGPYTSTAIDYTASDGPGGDWFFNQTAAHLYSFEGGLYIKSGTNEVVAGFTDATGGFSYGTASLDLSTGVTLYSRFLGSGQKLTRITGTDQVCDAVPPIEIGNRVWKDTNGNGIQDAGEPSLAGVTVELRDANGNLVATAVTDANGNYIFSNQPNLSDTPSQKYGLPITQLTNYTIDIASLGTDPSTTGLTLTGISPSPGETAGSVNTGSTIDNSDAFLVNGKPTISIKSPVDGLINHNYDFGFIGSTFDLALTKSLAPGQASVIKPGSNVTFAVVVYNQGSQPAYNIQLADYIPAGLTLNDANWTANSSTATLNTPIAGSLAAGSSTTVTITFTVSSTASGPIINKAEISSADNDTNPNNTPPTDVDSTPDTNPINDAGGNPNSGSDNSINGNGKGTPGDTNPTTDEDDEDPAIIYVQPCTLGVNLLTTEAHCGKADGRATVTVNTGVAPYTYAWSTGASTSAITGLTGGQTFTVTVTDANGCQDVLVGTIQSTGGPSLTATATAASCQQATGSATATATGGTGTYTYLWSNGATTATISNVVSGTYTVRVTDGAGCVSSLAVIVPSTSPLSVVATPTSSSCLGANGSVTLTVSGGGGSYSYLWNTGATTQNLTAVAGGTYKVNVTDANGCTAIATAVVSNTSAPTVSGTPTNPICFGTSTGSISLAVSGGSGSYSYQWDNGSTAQSLTSVQAGIYTVVVTDGSGCRSGASFTLTQPSRIVADIQSLSAVCNAQGGVTGGTLQVVSVVGGTPGYNYLWSTGSAATSLTGLAAGTYSLTVTDSKGCLALGQAVIDPWPTCAKASLGDYVWFDTNQNGQQDPTETGVASVTAVLHDAISGTVVSTTVTDGTGHYLFTNLDPGSYYVVFTAPSGTTFTTPNSGADATDSDVASLTGNTGSTGVYSLTAGEQNLTVDAGLVPLKAALGDYVWFDTNKNGQQDPTETGVASVTAVLYDAVSGTVVSTTLTDGTGHYLFSNLNPGSYYVKFTTPQGYTYTTANTGADATDSDAGVGGQTGVYSLTAGQVDLTVDAGLIPLPASLGDYVWFDTNQNGQQDPTETGVASVTAVLHDAVSGTVVSTTLTDGTGHYLFTNLNPGSYYVVFTAPSGTTFTTPNNGADATDSDAGAGGQTGVYSLTAGQQDLTVDAGLIPVPVFDLALKKTLASGQSANVVAGGTVTFTVSVYNQGNVDATNVQVTDYIPTGLTLNDAAWTASGGLATLNSVIASLPAGQSTTRNITFTVSNSFVGSLTNTAEISSASNAQNLPDKDSNPDNNPTNDGTPINDDTTGDHKNNPSQDEDDSDPEVITVSPAPVFDLALKKTLAAGQSTTVVAGSQVTFTVTVYNQGNVDATNVQVTDYIPTGLVLNDGAWTASNGTATLNSVIASLPAGQSVTRNITFIVSNSFAGGVLTNTAEISSASNAQNLPDKDSTPDGDPTNDGTPVNDDTSGDHKNNPSQDEDDSDPEPITVTPLCTALGLNTGTTLALCGQANGIATVVVNAGSGVAPYTYAWTNSQGTVVNSSSVAQGLAAGMYTITVTDSKGCTGQKMVTISAVSAPVIVAQVVSTSCGLPNGSATVTATGGSGSYTYQWTTSTGVGIGTSASVTNLAAGTYAVSVVDANGCSSMTSVVVGNSTPLSVVATVQNAVCGQGNGSISAQVSGGSPGYTYQWRNASGVVATSQNLANALPGSYSVIVTDATGCTALATANISNVVGPQLSGVVTNVKCFGTQTGSIVLTVTGGTPPIGYVWSNGATTQNLSNVGAGVYTVTARDANGCVAVQSFTITQPTEIAAIFQPTYPTCTSLTGGSVSLVSITGGTAPYSYTWSPGGATTASISGLSGGIYTLTIQDAAGCIASPLAVLPTPSNCTTPVFDLALKKTLASGQSANVVAGGTVTFTVSVYNQGNVDATNVQVTDYIPTGLTLNDGNWTASGGLATLNSVIASLPAGQSVTRNITFIVSNSFAGGVLTNTAEISSASNAQNLPDKDSTPDGDPTNDGTPVNDDTSGDHKNNPSQDEDDSDPEVITVSPAPVFDLALTKKLASGQSSTVVAGGTVTFTVSVYNQGNVDATNVQVTDYIPTGLTLNDANWTASGGLATLNSVIASLPAGQSTTRNITFTVSSSFAGGSITNTAEISSASNAQNLPDKDSSPDSNPTNDGTPVNDDTSGDHKNNPSQDEDDSDPETITITPLKASLGDYVWYDNNKNGQQDANEPPAVGVTVTLYIATTNQPIGTMVTDATGHYLFTNLDPGTYYVVFTAPSGATFTGANSGNDTTDSDAGVGGRTGNYTLAAGEQNLTVDAGLIPQCTSPNCFTTITVK